MFNFIKRTLIKRQMRKLPQVVQRDMALSACIEHILEEGCLCLANQAIRHPCDTQAEAVMDFFEHMTPLEVNRVSRTIGNHPVRDSVVSSDNLREFSNKYDCLFSRWWTEGQGRTLEELDSSIDA